MHMDGTWMASAKVLQRGRQLLEDLAARRPSDVSLPGSRQDWRRVRVDLLGDCRAFSAPVVEGIEVSWCLAQIT